MSVLGIVFAIIFGWLVLTFVIVVALVIAGTWFEHKMAKAEKRANRVEQYIPNQQYQQSMKTNVLTEDSPEWAKYSSDLS